MRKILYSIKKFTYFAVMSSCLCLTYIVVQEVQGNSVSKDATKVIKSLEPHVNKGAKTITRWFDSSLK